MPEPADTAAARARHIRGAMLVATAGALWSTLGLGVRLMEEASAWQIVFYRGLFQALAVGGLVLHRSRGRLPEAISRIGWPGVVGALGLAVAYNAMIVALTLAPVATVVFVFSAAPLVAGLLAWLVLGEPVRPATFAAMVLATIGILLMTLGEPYGGQLLGSLAAGVAVLASSVFTVSLRMRREVDMLPAVALSGVLAALMSSAAIDGFSMTGRDLALSAYLGAVALAVGLALFTAGSRELTAAELPLVAMTETVLAPVWVWLALGETIGPATLIGGGIVLGSVLLQGYLGAPRAPSSPAVRT